MFLSFHFPSGLRLFSRVCSVLSAIPGVSLLHWATGRLGRRYWAHTDPSATPTTTSATSWLLSAQHRSSDWWNGSASWAPRSNDLVCIMAWSVIFFFQQGFYFSQFLICKMRKTNRVAAGPGRDDVGKSLSMSLSLVTVVSSIFRKFLWAASSLGHNPLSRALTSVLQSKGWRMMVLGIQQKIQGIQKLNSKSFSCSHSIPPPLFPEAPLFWYCLPSLPYNCPLCIARTHTQVTPLCPPSSHFYTVLKYLSHPSMKNVFYLRLNISKCVCATPQPSSSI